MFHANSAFNRVVPLVPYTAIFMSTGALRGDNKPAAEETINRTIYEMSTTMLHGTIHKEYCFHAYSYSSPETLH